MTKKYRVVLLGFVSLAYAESILKQLDEKELYWSVDGKELEGNLKNYDNDEED